MTPSDLSLLAVCALAAASMSATLAWSKAGYPVRLLAARWSLTWAWISCAWCSSAFWSAAALAAWGPNTDTTTDWPRNWAATWCLAGLVAAAVRVVALPAVEPIEMGELANEEEIA